MNAAEYDLGRKARVRQLEGLQIQGASVMPKGWIDPIDPSNLPEAEQGLEEHHVPLSPETVKCEVEDHNCGRICYGAEKEVEKYVARELRGIQRKTAKNMFY